MRDLIGERPNLMPTGIGHSRSDINFDGTGGMSQPDMSSWYTTESERDGVSDSDHGTKFGDQVDDDEDGEDDDSEQDKSPSRKAGSILQPKQEGRDATTTGSGTKRKTPAPSRPTKKTKALDEYTTAIVAEETTRQKEVELAKTKIEVAGRVKVETHKAELQAKLEVVKGKQNERSERDQRKHEEKMAKMKFTYELQLAQARSSFAGTSSHAQAPSMPSNTGYSFVSASSSSATSTPSVTQLLPLPGFDGNINGYDFSETF